MAVEKAYKFPFDDHTADPGVETPILSLYNHHYQLNRFDLRTKDSRDPETFTCLTDRYVQY